MVLSKTASPINSPVCSVSGFPTLRFGGEALGLPCEIEGVGVILGKTALSSSGERGKRSSLSCWDIGRICLNC